MTPYIIVCLLHTLIKQGTFQSQIIGLPHSTMSLSNPSYAKFAFSCFMSYEYLRVPTCSSTPSWSNAPLEDQAASTMPWYPSQVTRSWHWVNQSLPSPTNSERLIRKLTSINIKVIGLTLSGFKPTGSEAPDLPKQEMDGLLIWPSHLASDP